MRAIVVGVGPHGRRVVDALRQASGVDEIEVVDRSAAALSDPRIGPVARRHSTLAEAAALGPLGLVVIATNGPSHAALCAEAIAGGASHLLVEKPMACSLSECDSIIDAASRVGCVVAVDHPRRSTPIYAWLADQLASGALGQLRACWVQRPGIGLGCLATHSFDLVRMVSGNEIRRVTAWLDPERGRNPRGADFHDPGGLCVLELSSGARAVVAQIEDGAGPMSFELLTTTARLRVEERDGTVDLLIKDPSVEKRPDQPAAFEAFPIPDGLLGKRVLRDEIRVLLEGLIGGRVLATADDGRASIEVLVASYLSHRRGNVPVSLPLGNDLESDLWLPVT